MRIIPKNTKVKIELFKGLRLADLIIGTLCVLLIITTLVSNIPGRLYITVFMLVLSILILVRLDGEPNYVFLINIIRFLASKKRYMQIGKNVKEIKDPKKGKIYNLDDMVPFTGIGEEFIEYGNDYYGAVLEIKPFELRYCSPDRQNAIIERAVGTVIRSVNNDYCSNIVKLERPVIYDGTIRSEFRKRDELISAFEEGIYNEDELKIRLEVINDRLENLYNLRDVNKVITDFYYIVIYDSDKRQLNMQIESAKQTLLSGDIESKRLNDKELAVFLKYSNQIDFDEREIENIAPERYADWAKPKSLSFKQRTVEVNNIVTHNLKVSNYPLGVNNAWGARPFSLPCTKVVIKFHRIDSIKAIHAIDRSLDELRSRENNTGIASKQIEYQTHIETLSELLVLLQNDNESIVGTNIYVTGYDIVSTRANKFIQPQPDISCLYRMNQMKKQMKTTYSEDGIRLNSQDFLQIEGYIGGQISGYDPMRKSSREFPTNTLAAVFPWIWTKVSDEEGFRVGNGDGVPVFVDFFKRDHERVNSNMVVLGKTGSGKSYSVKSLLANLAADNSKIFILDPENEYTELAHNFNGKFINVGNANQGRINPFQIITSLEDEDSELVSNSYSNHMQFLEEFFKQILPDCEKEALEFLNTLINKVYNEKEIYPETELNKLRAEDYPIFDDLYDCILREFQRTDSDYIKKNLRILMNYVSKFSSGGRNASIWNGPSSISTLENLIVFNFQSLLANRNNTIANAQMMLVLKYLDNEIMKNRDYNTRYNANRRIIIVVDEAHVFIDTKYPIALDFMFQMAKRIRKYNGMLVVISQNIKDFVGSEEIARKSTAIINACQYSMIFSLAPNDVTDLCKLYEKSGGINQLELDGIIAAQRGRVFTIISSSCRASFTYNTDDDIVDMFSNMNHESHQYGTDEGRDEWEKLIAQSRKSREKNSRYVVDYDDDLDGFVVNLEGIDDRYKTSDEDEKFSFVELTDEEYQQMNEEPVTAVAPKMTKTPVQSIELPDNNSNSDNGGGLEKLGLEALISQIRQSVKNEMEQEFDRKYELRMIEIVNKLDNMETMSMNDSQLPRNTLNDNVEDVEVENETLDGDGDYWMNLINSMSSEDSNEPSTKSEEETEEETDIDDIWSILMDNNEETDSKQQAINEAYEAEEELKEVRIVTLNQLISRRERMFSNSN